MYDMQCIVERWNPVPQMSLLIVDLKLSEFRSVKNKSQHRTFMLKVSCAPKTTSHTVSCQLKVALLLNSDSDGIGSQVSKHINKSQPGEQTH